MAALQASGACAASATAGGGFPTPLSPPYPAVSKEVELRRAMSAAARSGACAAAEVVFEDEWLVVANKPSGIYCETLLSILADPRGAAANQSNLHLANRLDRDTSGLMVITKCNKVAAKLVKAFTDHKVKKTYLALCVGNAPKWEKIKISSGHGRSKFGAFRVYSAKDVGRTLPGGSLVKHMTTSFEVLGINGRGKFRERSDIEKGEIESIIVQEKGVEIIESDDEKKDEILVRAYPQSGRTHQIRLHCQYLGMPIKGDVKYGGVYEWKGETCDAHALHAESLSFMHPITSLPLLFQAPLPLWAIEAMLNFKNMVSAVKIPTKKQLEFRSCYLSV
ncbi:RNA pseudouridine synthase 1 [Ananas comosus]|uniref:RNA pseudouridine synthase 1 n=1 Tax=Ananas comosus TaxID=4615 RepID=A0A199UWI9_ANACO|nr:RNA pseudouridine synthase 1 [Ananas comosus]